MKEKTEGWAKCRSYPVLEIAGTDHDDKDGIRIIRLNKAEDICEQIDYIMRFVDRPLK